MPVVCVVCSNPQVVEGPPLCPPLTPLLLLPTPPPPAPPHLPPQTGSAGQNRLLALNYVHPGESQLVCSAHVEWGRGFEAARPPLPPLTPADVDTTPGRPLVVSGEWARGGVEGGGGQCVWWE